MILKRQRLIFIHVRKTGGTSIERALKPGCTDSMLKRGTVSAARLGTKHGSARWYRERWPTQWEQYFSFSFIRNPWDWLVSRYYWSRHVLPDTFDEFMERLYARESLVVRIRGDMSHSLTQFPNLNTLRPQITMLTNDETTCSAGIIVNFIGQFERLRQDFDEVCRQAGIEQRALPHAYASKHPPYRECYTERTRKLAAEMYAADIEAFQYDF